MEIALITENSQPLKWENNGLTLQPDATIEDYESAIRVIAQLGTISTIALGDLLHHAEKKGIKAEQFALVFEEVGYSPVDTGKAYSIASVHRRLRNEKLSSEHYFVVAKSIGLGDVDAKDAQMGLQEQWLNRALKHNLSPLELKRSIEAGKVLKKGEIAKLSGRGSGIINYHGIVNQWERWANKVGGADGIKSWPTETLEKWLSEVKSVDETIAAARAELASRQLPNV